MPGPGMELIGEEEKRELLEVLESGYLFRYGSPDNPAFKAEVYQIDRTLNLDPEDVRKKVTPRTKAIMAVHMLGNPARLDELKAIADEHGLLLIEDCAQAFGASYKGRRVGSIGHAGIYSFNVYKTITAG